jgi:ribonuclease J
MTDPSVDEPSSLPRLEVVALGGLWEFGMNTMAVAWGDTLVVLDAGAMFPEPELLGVDLIIPKLTYLQQRAARHKALILTHGHEDHIGAVAHMMRQLPGPVYGTPLTLAMIEPKLAEQGVEADGRLSAIRPRDKIVVGDFTIEFLRVTHSMPDCVAVALHTPVGTIVHTGDYKIDQTPLDGEPFDFHRFSQLGAEGVLALFSDSTNIEREGVTGSELDVIEAFEEIFASTRGKIVTTSFATSIHRVQVLVNLAQQFGRKVAFVGRAMIETSQIAQRLGYLKVPADTLVRDSEVRNLPPGDVLCLVTGSQGEPMSALSRIAIDEHRHVSLSPEDTVVFSSREIPGNERAIDRVINHIARRGAEIITEGIKHVHVSGHGSAEELKTVLSLVRPRCFIPIHGTYRQRSRHARVAERLTRNLPRRMEIILAENGDLMEFTQEGGRIVSKVPAGRVLIDGTSVAGLGDEVLRDRRHLAEDGLVVPVLAINKQTGMVEGVPDLITRGLAVDPGAESPMRDAARVITDLLASASIEERTDYLIIRDRIGVELRRFFRKRLGQRPLVLPVIMEI